MTGACPPGPMGEFLAALAAKGETVEEITGRPM
jgi:anthranilate phosphoribosyltransferase